MANKHITNPCDLSGKKVSESLYRWVYAHSRTIYVICPECNNFVSVNRITNTFRKHSNYQVVHTDFYEGNLHDGELVGLEMF
jgi:hypothetical protein